MATRYGRDGIRCNVVAPGFILTDVRRPRRARGGSGPHWPTRIPLGRLGTPDDIAHAVGFLLSDRAGFVNGQVLRVDGGLTVSPRLTDG